MSKFTMPKLEGWKKYVGIYLVLLAVSHLVIWAFGKNISKIGLEQSENIRQVAVHPTDSTTVPVRYEDIYTGQDSDPAVLLLFPGGPKGASAFDELTPKLSPHYRLIVPHLPGSAETKKKLPDYSFKALSHYASLLLDQLHMGRVHVVGYGLGGASSIYLSHDYPRHVQSLSLVSSIGVQELSLLGNYKLNHAVYGVQLGIVWFLHNAVPHFGLFDLLDINVPYAKSYFESDQRPLRSYLKQYQKPMLILHGRKDALAPIAVAKEHHRIVPQSILKIYDADHDLIETHSDSVADAIGHFISDVEQGKATIASTASPERIAEAQKPFSSVKFSRVQGSSLYLLMFIIVLATLISEDLTCIGSGLLAARGIIGFWPATLACLIGIFLGDLGLYLAGRLMGRSAIRRAPLKWVITESDLKKSAKWFDVRGPAIIFITRFLPGSRLPTYFTAGVIRASFWMFASYFLLAAMVWTPLLVGISRILGNQLIQYFTVYKNYAIWGVIAAILCIIFIIKIVIPLFSYKGRRLLLSRYRQLTHWEYWSPVILYLPVFFYVIYLGIKYRCMTLFTAANPAIPEGGFVGESKTQILRLFNSDGHVARYECIPSSLDQNTKLQRALTFMKRNDLSFPIVLKPDVGQRGKGVSIIRNRNQMEEYLADANKDTIIQEYIWGREYGVFYYRYPDHPAGNIFSITCKDLLSVRGDGKRTLQELILEDDRAINRAKYHLQQNEERLFEIPDKGENVCIVELGTHARGASFHDGNKHITEALTNELNAISKVADGFYYGRFDIKVPSPRELDRGENIKIIEVNGVTSESTNIYDTAYSFWDAQKVLMQQWKNAFKIGKSNRQKGARVTPLLPFLKKTLQSLLQI